MSTAWKSPEWSPCSSLAEAEAAAEASRRSAPGGSPASAPPPRSDPLLSASLRPLVGETAAAVGAVLQPLAVSGMLLDDKACPSLAAVEGASAEGASVEGASVVTRRNTSSRDGLDRP